MSNTPLFRLFRGNICSSLFSFIILVTPIELYCINIDSFLGIPYNVIRLTCTVVALYFGSVFNTLERRYRDVFIDNKFLSDRPIFKLLRKIGGLFSGKQKQKLITF